MTPKRVLGRALPGLAAVAVMAVVAAAGCASAPPPRLHSLLGAPVRAAAPGLSWRLATVALPAQADRPQFVVRRADGSYVVLEHERWQAPLQDELHDALAEQLAARLGPAGQVPAAGRAEWRVTLDVQRFDATPGRSTLVARWRLQSATLRAGLACAVHLEQPTGNDAPALAQGHRQNVQRLAAALAPVLQALDAGGPAACPG